MRAARIAALIGATLAASGARAGELPELADDAHKAPAWTFASPSDPGCAIPAPQKSVAFAVRNSPRLIGPYVVNLPGYAGPAPDQDGFDPYGPFLVTARPGDELAIDLQNQLDDAPINLHTHGVVTRPRPYGRPCNAPGDYIFATVEPVRHPFPTQGNADSAHHQPYLIKIPTKVRGIGDNAVPRPDGDVDDFNPFPTGVYWIHSHINGDAKNDVWAGQSALLDIEDPNAKDPVSLELAKYPTKYVALRDLQLAVPKGQYPDAKGVGGVAPTAAAWIKGDDYQTMACDPGSQPNIKKGVGYCAIPRAPVGGSASPTQDLLWLFTVNGAVAPDINFAAEETQRWKVANLSSVVTYVLDIADASCMDEPCDEAREETFRIAKIDGVATGTPDPVDPTKKQLYVSAKQLFLPPAARAEIVVTNTAGTSEKSLYLRTRGFNTGLNTGDPWPLARLAAVKFAPAPQMVSPQAMARNEVAYSVRTPAPPSAAAAPIPRNCVTLPDGYRRRITLTQNDSPDPATNAFMVGSEVVSADGAHNAPVDANGLSSTIPPVQFEHGNPPASIPHVCAKLGTEEIWEVVNTTHELHNFHIHQGKFTLATEADAARLHSLPSTYKNAQAFFDPSSLIASQVSGFGSGSNTLTGVDVWHDTLPVPPASFDKDGNKLEDGRVFIRAPFFDDRQVGTYVFHCHILEHEDKGMMSVLEVYDPDRWNPAVKQGSLPPSTETTKLGFCGRPPANAGDYAVPTRRAESSVLANLLRFGR